MEKSLEMELENTGRPEDVATSEMEKSERTHIWNSPLVRPELGRERPQSSSLFGHLKSLLTRYL